MNGFAAMRMVCFRVSEIHINHNNIIDSIPVMVIFRKFKKIRDSRQATLSPDTLSVIDLVTSR